MEGQVWSLGALGSCQHPCSSAVLSAVERISLSDSAASGCTCVFGSQGICYLFCFGFLEFTVLYCGDDDSTLLFQDQGVAWVCISGGGGQQGYCLNPAPSSTRWCCLRWGCLSTWWNSSAVSSLGVQTVISRKGCAENGYLSVRGENGMIVIW